MGDQPTHQIPPAEVGRLVTTAVATTEVDHGGVNTPVHKSQVIRSANPIFRPGGGRAWPTLWMGLRTSLFKNTNFARVAASVWAFRG
jgi:hypothetical protein